MPKPEPTLAEMEDLFQRLIQLMRVATNLLLGVVVVTAVLWFITADLRVAIPCTTVSVVLFAIKTWAQTSALRITRGIWQRKQDAL